MAKIIQVNRPGNEIREIVSITMEEWYRLRGYEDNRVIVDNEPISDIGDRIEISYPPTNGQYGALDRIIVDIQKDDSAGKWIVTLNEKGEINKKVSVITLRLNAEEARDLAKFKKMVGKKSASEALKFIIKEFPRWKQTVNENLESARETEAKYQNLKKANTEFMIAFQNIVNVVNGDD